MDGQSGSPGVVGAGCIHEENVGKQFERQNSPRERGALSPGEEARPVLRRHAFGCHRLSEDVVGSAWHPVRGSASQMTVDGSAAPPRGRSGLPRDGCRPGPIPGMARSCLTTRKRDKTSADDRPRRRQPGIGRPGGLGLSCELVLKIDEVVIGIRPCDDAAGHHPMMALIATTARAYNPRTTTKGGRPMPKYLTQEWLDDVTKMAQGQPDRPGASARMQYVVTGGPEGDIKYYWVLENGKLLENKVGEISDADFTLTLTWDDSVKVQKGELDANAAFMQGRMKVTGNMGKLMQLMPLTNSPEYKELQEEIRGITEY